MTPEETKLKILEELEKISDQFKKATNPNHVIICRKWFIIELIDLTMKKVAEAIFEDIYGWCCTAAPGADADDLDVWYLIKESVFNELKRKWCKKC